MKDIFWEALQNQPDLRHLLNNAASDLNQGGSVQQISAKLANDYARS